MTGPWHYAEAERLIEEANHVGHTDSRRGSGMLAAAQVHAILGLTAAIVADSIMRREDRREWDAATGYQPECPVEAVFFGGDERVPCRLPRGHDGSHKYVEDVEVTA